MTSRVKLIPPSFIDHLHGFISNPVETARIYDPSKRRVGVGFEVGSGPSGLGSGSVNWGATKHLFLAVEDHVSSLGELLEAFPVVALSRDPALFPHVCCQTRTLFVEDVHEQIPSCLCVAVVVFDSDGYTVYIPFGGGQYFKAKRYTTDTSDNNG